jgi:hypothetical protein
VVFWPRKPCAPSAVHLASNTIYFIRREFGLLSSKAMQQAVREEDEVCERLNLLLDVLVAHRELCERHEKGVAQDHNKALAKMLSLKKRQMQGVIRGTDVSTFQLYCSKGQRVKAIALSCLDYSSTLKMEAAYSSETSLNLLPDYKYSILLPLMGTFFFSVCQKLV